MNEFVGEKFGMLTIIGDAISKAGKDGEKRKTVMCRCDCGVVKPVLLQNLKNGTTKSCGNHSGEHHGMSKTRLYRTWRNMRERCNNQKAINYKNYGARGIQVCDKWNRSFTEFMRWAVTNGYTDNLTIDRIDHEGNYSPENCRWATSEEQENNKRNNKNITLFGETKTESQWCKIMHLSRGTISRRMRSGDAEINAITKPPLKKRGKIARLIIEIDSEGKTLQKKDIDKALSKAGINEYFVLTGALQI